VIGEYTTEKGIGITDEGDGEHLKKKKTGEARGI